MRLSAVVASCLSLLFVPILSGAAHAAPFRVSGPVVHDNLAVYFLRGPSAKGAAPLTLDEALRRKSVTVHETGNVNALEVENLGAEPVFIQAGDIVKGGKQDRTLMVSLLLPPKSGRVPIASFCVEEGRWSPRAAENVRQFESAGAMVPSRDIKLAMQAPIANAPADLPRAETSARQSKVWETVAAMQSRLTSGTGSEVRAKASSSSLQLALENEKLAAMRAAYVNALKDAGEKGGDIVGFVFSVNGVINSGDAYGSHALFRKMWPKLIEAAAVEAIGRRNDKAAAPPPAEVVRAFVSAAEAGKASERPLAFGMQRKMHESKDGYLIEAALKDGYVHRSYLAK